jgi:hypothetical protein
MAGRIELKNEHARDNLIEQLKIKILK